MQLIFHDFHLDTSIGWLINMSTLLKLLLEIIVTLSCDKYDTLIRTIKKDFSELCEKWYYCTSWWYKEKLEIKRIKQCDGY